MASQGRLAAYAAGNKVYGSGRSNPTSGPVDPTGYIDRSNNKNASNRRSGLAQAAGRRLKNSAASAEEQPVVPSAVSPQPSYGAPITLADGRKIMANPTGQYVFIENEPELGGSL